MLRALKEAASRFKGELPPLGYDSSSIRWVIEIDSKTGVGHLSGPFGKNELAKSVPSRGDRSGNVSEKSDKNVKPALLVDNATYALGIAESGKVETAQLVHRGFRNLLAEAFKKTRDREIQGVIKFLAKGLRDEDKKKIKPKDIIAFKVQPHNFPFETKAVQSFWADYLRREYSQGEAECSVCGCRGPIMRILPWQISFFGYSCPITAFNAGAFRSFGKEQTENASLCFDCAGTASRVLQYLVKSERHSAVLSKDDAKGAGKTPLRNQLAIFWLKENAGIQDSARGITISGDAIEEALKAPLAEKPDEEREGPPPEVGQLKSLLNVPWSSAQAAFRISKNSFFLAVISPNKSRLVIREWIEESIESVWKNLKDFEDALSIVRPDGASGWPPTIFAILESLKPENTRSAVPDPNLLRGLLRAAYTGASPPPGLLETAVRRFRVPDKPVERKDEREKQAMRRMALAAAMKLVLTYRNTEEARAMEQLDEKRKTPPYLCGRLLAVLEEIQQRAAGWDINTTLVDRFYGSASTAPASVFGNLMKLAISAHLPKIRRENRGHAKMEQQMEAVTSGLDDSGGFPNTLAPVEQADFALGFYSQRAKFRADRPARKTEAVKTQTQTNAQRGGVA